MEPPTSGVLYCSHGPVPPLGPDLESLWGQRHPHHSIIKKNDSWSTLSTVVCSTCVVADLPDTFFWVPWGMYEWHWGGFGPGWSFSVVVRAFYKFFYKAFYFKKNYKTLPPQQKTTTLVQILFRATHTYPKEPQKRCLVNQSKNRVALVLFSAE